MIFESIGKFLLFGTNLFGHYTIRKGLLSMYSVMLPTLAIAMLYAYFFFAGSEKTYVLIWMYKL